MWAYLPASRFSDQNINRDIYVVILSAVDRQRRKIPPGVTALALNIHKDSAARKVFLSIATYVYRMGIGSGAFSYATAIGLFQGLINLVLLMTANQVSKRLTGSALY